MNERSNQTTKRDQFWKGVPRPVNAWAALDRKGRIMPASIRDSADGVRLACGECVPIPVVITFLENLDG